MNREQIEKILDPLARKGGMDLLFTGEAGTGKTTLAHRYAKKIGIQVEDLFGDSMTYESLAMKVMYPNKSVIFIDEIHSTDPALLEYLYTYMIDGKFYLKSCSKMVGNGCRHVIVGATTNEEKIPAPLVSRFALKINISPMTIDESRNMLKSMIKKSGLDVDDNDLDIVIDVTWGNPRKMVNFLKTISALYDIKKIDRDAINGYMLINGLSPHGLSDEDIQYMQILAGNEKPIALLSISTIMGKHRDYIMESIEGRMFRMGFVDKTSRGRTLSSRGIEYMRSLSGLGSPIEFYGGRP